MVQLMLDNRSPVNATDSNGQSALHHGKRECYVSLYASTTTESGAAIAEGHGDIAVLLLKAGIEPHTRDSDGHLPIELAPDNKVMRVAERVELES